MEIRASSDKVQAILEAACAGQIDVLASVTDDSTLQAARCSSGCTALHWAAGHNQVQTVHYLIAGRNFPPDAAATSKARGRTPLHYACRNGCLETAVSLVETHGADPDLRAKHGVTPFQLAVWRNNLQICQWLVESCGVLSNQVNEFACGAVHWMGIAPMDRANTVHDDDTDTDNDTDTCNADTKDGNALLPLAQWLAEQPAVDYTARQRQGHSALHKAAWGGHLALVGYLHETQGLWDDMQDEAGNYAADLCDMANTARHAQVATYLRNHCSRERAESCDVLGVTEGASDAEIRQAYRSAARKYHPDKCASTPPSSSSIDFDAIVKAYQHLTLQQGRGSQSNPAHSLKLMLQQVSSSSSSSSSSSDAASTLSVVAEEKDDDCFKARLVAVLLEYGDRGLDLSNLKKKWQQVWPDTAFPVQRSTSLSKWIRQKVGDMDSVDLQADDKGSLRLYARNCTQAKVAAAAVAAAAQTSNVQRVSPL